jgi:SAM-dependent methyltransferase
VSRAVDLETLAQHWSEALAAWAIPPEVLALADRDPWSLPVERFTHRADLAVATPEGPSFERAAEVLRVRPGSVLDVGAGAGAASLPLARWATHVTAVDLSHDMLAAFADRAEAMGVEHTTVEGSWPEVADKVGPHAVSVAHHVVYNVADIVPFLHALDAVTTRRVVLELPTHHPLSWMNPLWERFHHITRPTAPTAGDLVEIVSAMGVDDLAADYWSAGRDLDAAGTPAEPAAQAELVTQRLCLPVNRAHEVTAALTDLEVQRDLVTVSWTPAAP